MRKKIAFKYLMIIFAIAISFFMFSNIEVKAETVQSQIDGVDDLYFDLEEIVDGEPSNGYSIAGVSCGVANCLDGVESINNLSFPDEYLANPVLEIKDGNSVTGVLDNIASIVTGKISGGKNLKTIGVCSFCNFTNIEEIEFAESVVLIKDYAFSNSGVSILTFNRYETIGTSDTITSLDSVNVFSGVIGGNLSKIVFAKDAIADYYKESSVWRDLDSTILAMFTYRITYRFYSNESTSEDRVYYNGFALENIPSNLVREGFDFLGWFSSEFDNEQITSESIAKISTLSADYLIHEVRTRWQLSKPTITMNSYFEGNLNSLNTIVYAGKDKVLRMEVSVDHVLEGNGEFQISYAWRSRISGITTNLTNISDSYEISFVKQSGEYTCYVTTTYDGYSREDMVSLTATVTPKDLLINVNDNETVYGTYVGAKEVETTHFEIDESTSLIEGERIKNYNSEIYTNNDRELSVNTYADVLKVTILTIGVEGSETNYIDNYKISYDYGDLTVNKKSIAAKLENDFNFVYGESESLVEEIEDVVYVSINNDEGITNNLVYTYSREKSTTSDADSYSIIGVSVNNSNYSVSLDSTSTGKVVISPKPVEVVWSVDENLVYDDSEKSVSALYKDNSNKDVVLNVEIKKNGVVSEMINAGTYNVEAKMVANDSNYALQNNTRDINIARADSAFIGNERQTKVYNGLPQSVEVSLNHSESTVVYGDYSSCKNAHITSTGTCTITVEVSQSENYNALSQNFRLHIDPYEFIVEPELFKFKYGETLGGKLIKVYDGVNNEKVNVYFSKEGSSTGLSVGTYNIGSAYLADGTDTINYRVTMVEGSGANKIEIEPALVQVRFFYYTNLVYDGRIKEIGIRVDGTTENVGLKVDYNGKDVIRNAGEYRINLSLENTNFKIEGNDYLEFEIKKADYDISNLRLVNKKVAYNFTNHFIMLEGEMPEGLSATYTIDGNKGNGTSLPFKHTVRVVFDGDFENYNYIEPMEAVLNISLAWLWISLSVIVVLGGGGFLTLYILVKNGKVRIAKRIKKSALRNVIRKNKEIMAINEMFRNKRKEVVGEIEEGGLIEEPVKFVKNPVDVPHDELLSMSFVDKLFKSNYGTKQFYSEVKNELLSYEGIVSKIKRDYETFYVNNMPVAKFNVVDGVLQVYFALDPTQYRKDEYGHNNVSKEKDFVAVPLNLTVNSIESLRHAKMFVRIIRKREGLKSASNFIRTDYVSVYTAKDESFRLFKKALIKKGKEDREED